MYVFLVYYKCSRSTQLDEVCKMRMWPIIRVMYTRVRVHRKENGYETGNPSRKLIS